MKVAIFTLLLPLISISLRAQTLSLGSTAVYGDDIGAPGINVRGYFNTKDHKRCIGPEFTWFNTTETEGGFSLDRRLFEFNLNGHYVFEVFDGFGVNPITGINFSSEVEEGGPENEQHEVQAWGWNIGAGFHYFIGGNFVVIGEWDHLVGKLSQNTYTLGLLYSINLSKRKGSDTHHDH